MTLRMISRASARLIGETLSEQFTRTEYNHVARRNFHSNNQGAIYDFLFDDDYPAWLCNAARAVTTTRGTKDFFMKLHTGESQMAATPDWTWVQRQALGQQYLKQLAESIIGRSELWSSERTKIERLQRQLELDGYTIRAGTLIPSEADVLDAGEEAGILETLYREQGLGEADTILHHLAMSEEHYIAQRWDDSISQSRKFLEGVLQQVALARGVDPDDATWPKRVRAYLVDTGLLTEKEKQTLAALYAQLSDTGGHPNMAEDEQARLLRHMALTWSQFVMLRLRAN